MTGAKSGGVLVRVGPDGFARRRTALTRLLEGGAAVCRWLALRILGWWCLKWRITRPRADASSNID